MIYAISLLLAGAQAVPPAGVNTLAVTDDPATEAWHTMLRNHAASQGRTLTSQVVSKQEVDVGPQVNLKGERHTGTFFMEALIQHNFAPKTCPNTGGFEGNCAKCAHGFEKSSSEPTANTYCCWAHGYANAQCAGFTAQQYPAHVFLTRSPYTWALAMHAQPYEYEGNYSVNRSVHRAARTVHGSHCTPCSQCAPHTEIAAPRVGAAATGPSPTSSAPSLPTSRSRTAAATRVARAR